MYLRINGWKKLPCTQNKTKVLNTKSMSQANPRFQLRVAVLKWLSKQESKPLAYVVLTRSFVPCFESNFLVNIFLIKTSLSISLPREINPHRAPRKILKKPYFPEITYTDRSQHASYVDKGLGWSSRWLVANFARKNIVATILTVS